MTEIWIRQFELSSNIARKCCIPFRVNGRLPGTNKKFLCAPNLICLYESVFILPFPRIYYSSLSHSLNTRFFYLNINFWSQVFSSGTSGTLNDIFLHYVDTIGLAPNPNQRLEVLCSPFRSLEQER